MNLTSVLLSLALDGAEWVLYLLVFLSVLSVMIMVERGIVLMTTETNAARLRQALDSLDGPSSVSDVLDRLRSLQGVEADVIREGLERAAQGPDAVEEAIAGFISLKKLSLERGIAFLGTVGSNAPFIGLFGTVLGIIKAFHDLARNQGGGSAVVMAGISEALVATAVGLMVAIPAVMAYNFFQRRIKKRMAHVTALSHLVLAGLRARDEEDTHGIPTGR